MKPFFTRALPFVLALLLPAFALAAGPKAGAQDPVGHTAPHPKAGLKKVKGKAKVKTKAKAKPAKPRKVTKPKAPKKSISPAPRD
jgi:hypothetical protein